MKSIKAMCVLGLALTLSACGGTEEVDTGAVRVDEDAQVGAGAVVIPSRTVGARSVVGAGAVVTHDVAPGITAVGVPAHEIRH